MVKESNNHQINTAFRFYITIQVMQMSRHHL